MSNSGNQIEEPQLDSTYGLREGVASCHNYPQRCAAKDTNCHRRFNLEPGTLDRHRAQTMYMETDNREETLVACAERRPPTFSEIGRL
jgi:hypothetical protein